MVARSGRPRGSRRRCSSDLPIYGQFNFLTATAFDDTGEFVDFGRPAGAAFFSVGAPVGEHGDWTARATMNSGDITSWTMAGEYATRAPAHQRYALGMTYSLQRYEGGNFVALQAVPNGHRKVASISASHDVDVSPSVTVGYGAKYEHYDYLEGYGLLSPTVRRSVVTHAARAVPRQGHVAASRARGGRVRAAG